MVVVRRIALYTTYSSVCVCEREREREKANILLTTHTVVQFRCFLPMHLCKQNRCRRHQRLQQRKTVASQLIFYPKERGKNNTKQASRKQSNVSYSVRYASLSLSLSLPATLRVHVQAFIAALWPLAQHLHLHY